MVYLKRLPLDELKIDRAFVRDMLTDATSSAIAQAIVSLSRAMRLSLLAEGVETEQQRQSLAAAGWKSRSIRWSQSQSQIRDDSAPTCKFNATKAHRAKE